MGTYIFCAATAKQSQTRTENQTCFGRSAFAKLLSSSPSNEYRASMRRGVVCITGRAEVYAMMMRSINDDQIRQPTLHRWGNGSVSIKKYYLQYHIMSNPPPLLLRGQVPTSFLAHKPSAIPPPAITVPVYPVPDLNISQSCRFVRVSGAYFLLLLFLCRPGEPKGPKYFFRNTLATR